ncbi:MAG: hypothetical protein ACTH7L_11210 [Psychrobacter alimentarius]
MDKRVTPLFVRDVIQKPQREDSYAVFFDVSIIKQNHYVPTLNWNEFFLLAMPSQTEAENFLFKDKHSSHTDAFLY